ncbi:MAG TPA: M57 family metalloprotease [Chryseosolibacter sp.]|nr:M57 family metalloprotease [Chryseosolibacter sp.]
MMKKFLSIAAIATIGAVFSCQTEDASISSSNGVSDEALAKIRALGFSAENVQLVDDGYLVEGDIMLHAHDLDGPADSKKLRIAEVEQYHTFNLVDGPRTITVSVSGTVSGAFSNAVNNAIARYNAQNLSISMQRVSSGGDINIKMVNTGRYIASAGFPDRQGDPYPTVNYAKKYSNYSDGFMTTVIAHEIGHCIGFRHTDYMNRAYSCGSGGSEGAGSVGAVHIPGTPTGPDNASWMLACLSASTNRPFNANDREALSYLY